MAQTERPKLNRNVSATTGATTLFRELSAYRKERGELLPKNLGQGIETEKPGDTIEDIFAELKPNVTSGSYSPSGSTASLRETAAAWTTRFLNVPATMENTLAFGVQSRASLEKFFLRQAIRARKAGKGNATVLVGDRRWTMIDEQLDDHGVKSWEYDARPGEFAISILGELRKDDYHDIDAIYMDVINNPTGTIRQNMELQFVFQGIETTNDKRKHAGVPFVEVFIDNPYYMAYQQRKIEGLSHLDTGFENVLDDPRMLTPWMMSTSFSKSLAVATPGFHIVTTHPKYTKEFAELAHRSYGDAMTDAMRDDMTRILQPQYDQKHLEHYGKLRNKYTQNRGTMIELFGTNVEAGDPSMTCTVVLPKDMFGCTVKAGDNEYVIQDCNDMIEYLALEKNVITVNNGMDKEGNALLRVAHALKHEEFVDAADALHQGVNTVKQAAMTLV